ncbi:hypothetical protein, partial [uncultured Bilophila sp.]|uniref:hypothetical protein n=1 Tax=uncultured Bilophila sp. TaxID=529385 RepID=UPI0026329FAC
PATHVDSAKNDVFWQKANFDLCKKSKFICARKPLFFRIACKNGVFGVKSRRCSRNPNSAFG